MEYLKKQFEGVGNVFFFKRNDSESIAEARANVQEISDVHRNCENHERANAVMTSVVEADDVNGRIRGIASNSVCSTVQQKQNKGSSTNANQTETEWRNGEGTSPKDAEKLSQSFEQSDSPVIARNIMSQDSFVTVTTESGKVSECFTFTKPVEIEKEIESKASEENRQPSTMTATLAREFGHGRKLERTKYEGDDIESLIISSNKARGVLKQDVGKDVKVLLDEAAIELVYPGANVCIQSEKKEVENSKEGRVVALRRDEKNKKAAEILMHSQINELLKQNSTNTNTERKGNERDERLDANASEESVFCDDGTRASLSTTTLPTHSFEAGIMPQTVNASSTVKFEEVKFISNNIKEVKKYSPLLLARLKQMNERLRELRVQLLQVQKIGEDKTKETKLADDAVALY